MAKLEAAMREAIARGARRQVRLVVVPLRREVLRLRRKVAEARGTMTSLGRSATAWERMMEAAPPVMPVSAEEAKLARLSPRLVQSLRKRLVSRSKVWVDTLLGDMMLSQGGGHGQTQERQEVPGGGRGARWR